MSIALCDFHAEEPYETECIKCDLLAYMKKKSADAYERGVKAGYMARLMDVDDLMREMREDIIAKCIEVVENENSKCGRLPWEVEGMVDALRSLQSGVDNE